MKFDLLLKGIPTDSPYFVLLTSTRWHTFFIDRRLLYTSQDDTERILETSFADICVRK